MGCGGAIESSEGGGGANEAIMSIADGPEKSAREGMAPPELAAFALHTCGIATRI